MGVARREDLDLPIVEAEAAIDRGDLRLERPLVRQEQPRRAALDDRGRDGAAVDVGERLRGEDDGGVLLAQRLQPFAELAGKALVVEGEPALVDDEQRRPAVEPVLDAVEEIGEHRGRRAGADQPLGLEGLDVGLAEPLGLGVEQPAPRAADAIGLQRLLQRVGLQQHRQAGERALGGGRRGQRGQRRPEMLLELRA